MRHSLCPLEDDEQPESQDTHAYPWTAIHRRVCTGRYLLSLRRW